MLSERFASYGGLEVTVHQLAYQASRPEQMMDRWERFHPMWVGARQELEPAGEWERLREDMMMQLEGITIDDLCRQASTKGIGVGADAEAEPTKVIA